MLINSYGPIVPALQGGQIIVGNWNAALNSPFLQDGIGNVGNTYIVSVAGTQNLGHGDVNYNIGDQVYFTQGGIWEVIASGNSVISANGTIIINSISPFNRQVLLYNTATQTYINASLTSNDVGLNNVQNVDTTNQANVTLQTPGFLPVNTTIINTDSGLDIAQKAQGQINAINTAISNVNVILGAYGTQIADLQTNSIQEVNGITGNAQLALINGINTTVNTNNVSGITTLSVDVQNATISIIGATRTATQLEANNNAEAFAYITPQTLNNSVLASSVSTNTINIANLQTNSIQTVVYSGGSVTGNNQLEFINSNALTWTLNDNLNVTQVTLNVRLATSSVTGIVQPDGTSITINGSALISVGQATTTLVAGAALATLSQVNLGISPNTIITPLTLASSILASNVATLQVNVTNLQNNAIQSISYVGGTITNNNQLQFINAGAATWLLADSGSITQAIVNIATATTLSLGLVQPNGTQILINGAGIISIAQASTSLVGGAVLATLAQVNAGTSPDTIVTPNSLANSVLASNVATLQVNVSNLQTNSIQSIIYTGGTITGNNQLQFVDSATVTWLLADSGSITQATATVPTATNSIFGVSRPNNTQVLISSGILSLGQSTETLVAGIAVATQAQTNAGLVDNVAITPLKLANSTLASTVATHTVNITNLQANSIQTINGQTGNNGLIIQNAQLINIPTADSGINTIVTFPNTGPGISGLSQNDGISIKSGLINPLQLSAPLSQSSNLLLNAGWDLWQSGTNFNITTQTKTFFADQWFIDTSTSTFIGTINVLQNTQVNNFTTQPFEPAKYLAQIQVSAYTSGNYYVSQSIENVNTISNEYVTFTIVLYCTSAFTAPVNIVQYFGTGGSPSATVITSIGTLNYTIPNTFQLVSVTGLVPSVAGKIWGTNINDSVSVRIQLPNIVNTYYLGRSQLQRGQISTPFDVVSASVDYMKCLRYYQILNRLIYLGDVTNGGSYAYVYSIPIPMRGIPTVALWTNIGQSGFPVGSGIPTILTGTSLQENRISNAGLLGQVAGYFQSTWNLRSQLTY